MRTADEMKAIADMARHQATVSRAPDFWQGVEDGVRWCMGEYPEAIQAWLMATESQKRTGGLI